MAKKIKRLLAILLVLSFCMAQMIAPAFAWDSSSSENESSSQYEWYQVYVNGALVNADQGSAGNHTWLVQGVYSWNVTIGGTTMSWRAGAHSGTVDLRNYITIPEGYEIAENGYTVEHKSVEGVNSQSDRFDNAIITVTIKALYNEETGETVPVTEPTEPPATEPPATEPPATEPPATEPPATEPPATEPPATEPPAPVDYSPSVSVTKSADKAVYEIGETITWTITVVNTSEYTAYNVVVNDPLTGDSWNLASLAPGASQVFTATSVAAEEGKLKNVVVTSWTDNDEIPDGDETDEPKTSSDEEIVEVEKPEPIDYAPYVNVLKVADKAVYEIGETITWTITVANTSEYTAYDVAITDALTGDSWNLASLAPGASQVFTATSVAAQPGALKNVVVTSWTDNDEIPDGDETDEPKTSSDEEIVEINEPAPTEPEPTDPPVPTNHTPLIQVTKTAEKNVYEVGETVVWTITVTNVSEYTAYDVVVTDELTGDQWTVAELAPGVSCVYTATSVAAEPGALKNVVITSWTDNDEIPDENEPEETKETTDEEIVTVEEPEPINYTPVVEVTKVADKEVYKIGEVITWTITVTNTGDCSAFDVTVADEMTGDEWLIPELAPGAVRVFNVTAVAEQAGQLRNVIVTSWTDNDEVPDEDEPEEIKETTDEEIVDVVEPVDYEPVLQVNKIADKRTYRPGERIVWHVLVRNISEYTAYNVVITDEITGDVWTIPQMEPGAYKGFVATSKAGNGATEYNKVVVTWEDNDEIPDEEEIDEIFTAEDEEIVNIVIPTPDPVDPDPIDPVDPDPTDPVDPDPTDPVNPDPIDPVDPDPTDPVNPDPVDPVNPDPVDPVNPDPTDEPDPANGEIQIPDEDVPLADVPKTGDVSILWAAASMLSAGGLVAVNRKRKEE